MSAFQPNSTDPVGLVGSILERKYRIDRMVAEGGFGLVYAGHHLALDVPIALKVLRPSLRERPDDWQELFHQFREEASVLSCLRRANVVAVLDSGVAPLGDDSAGLPWMALEWLDGETLKDDLARRRGRGGRTHAECMDLLRPVLEAIAEAHEHQIAHRDLKPSNIMLVPTKGGLAPRVLDFGIAKMMAPDRSELAGDGDTATDSTFRAFTAASAAPEQLSGSRTGPWTDVYALGLLLTEVLTDQNPIDTDDSSERHRIAFATERPTPAALGIDVGPWEEVLTRALAVRPSDRQPDARTLLTELDTALERASTLPLTRASSDARTQPVVPRSRTKTLIFGGVAVLASLAAGAAIVREVAARRSDPVLSIAARPLVIVAEFRARGVERRIASAFAELLSEQLRIGDTLRIPAADTRAAMLEASGLEVNAPDISTPLLARLRDASGADLVLGGDVTLAGGALRADIELHDAARGTHLGTISLSGAADDLNALVREAGARVRRTLGRPGLSVEDETALRASLPENAQASVAYVDGLSAQREFRFRDAATRFEEVNRLAPRFAPALSALAAARLKLGEQDRAREAADRAVELASGLPRGDELLVNALAAETRHDWSAAVDNYRALAQFYPDRVDFVTSLARALVGAGKAPDANSLLDSAKKRPHSDWDAMRMALIESYVDARQSKDTASMDAAREAERLATKLGARVPLADAILEQAHDLHRAGRLDEAEALFVRARAIYVAVKDDDNVLHCDAGLSEIAQARGDFAHAIALMESTAAAYRAAGNTYRLARETVQLCTVHAYAGELREARTLCDEGARLFAQAHDREGEGFGLINVAEIDIMLGNLDGTAERIQRGRDIEAAIAHAAGVAEADAALARLAWLQGHLSEADAGFEKAFAEASAVSDAALLADVSLDRARVAFDRASPVESARFAEAEKAVTASSDVRLLALLDAFAARRAAVRGDRTAAASLAIAAETKARQAHARDALALALAVGVAAGAADPTKRAEAIATMDALEAIEPKVMTLLLLSHGASGDQAVAFAERAFEVAKSHGLAFPALLARRDVARARGSNEEVEVANKLLSMQFAKR